MTRTKYCSRQKRNWSVPYVMWSQQNSEVDVVAIECPQRICHASQIACIYTDCGRGHTFSVYSCKIREWLATSDAATNRNREASEISAESHSFECCRNDQPQVSYSINVKAVQNRGVKKTDISLLLQYTSAISDVLDPVPTKIQSLDGNDNCCVPRDFCAMYFKIMRFLF